MTESVLVDTNVFIEIFRRRNQELQEFIDSFDRTCINTIVYFEMVRGEPSRERYAAREIFLQKYELIHIDPIICDLAISLMRRFKLSNGLDFPDALIASTCITHNLFLYTRNIKHFDFIPDLTVF